MEMWIGAITYIDSVAIKVCAYPMANRVSAMASD
jgi:hypothetical protein